MNKDEYVSGLAKNKHFLKLYGEKRLKDWLDRNQSLPAERQALRASRLVLPDHAAGGAGARWTKSPRPSARFRSTPPTWRRHKRP